jgi:lipopolysaccharide/colanic/teichoic acid biosynthesis glycosyltransferase
MQLPSRALESSALSAPAFPIAVLPPAIQIAPDRETRIKSPSASDWSLSESKRLFDLSIALLVLALLGLPLLAIALCVRLCSRGPAFFVQQRVGRWGQLFRIYKFRTMTFGSDKNGPAITVAGDRRITALGRWLRRLKIDELPQFYNVLRGEMSMVGPRPPVASEVEQYDLSHLRRLDVQPGMTGLWQVEARQDPSFDSYISLDTAYVENWNLWLDLKILARTVGVVFSGTGS